MQVVKTSFGYVDLSTATRFEVEADTVIARGGGGLNINGNANAIYMARNQADAKAVTDALKAMILRPADSKPTGDKQTALELLYEIDKSLRGEYGYEYGFPSYSRMYMLGYAQMVEQWAKTQS